jgi:MFS transporter, ACS family, glucarate transporter
MKRSQSLTGKTRVRYRVLAYGVLLAGITYMDRVCISQASTGIMRDLQLDKVQMGMVFSAFTLAYGIFEIPTGWWGDKIGTRRVLTRIVIWWSSFTIVTAAAFNYYSLLIIRFLFGAGEAGAWPNAAKTFSRWFPSTERGRAQGIFFAGAHLGGGLTPILVTWMLTMMHWRWLFVIFGAIGFFWAAAWYRWFRDEPSEHPEVNAAEVEYIVSGRVPESSHKLDAAAWKKVLTNRSLIFLCLQYFTQSYGFYFFITWLPKYLEEARGFNSMLLGLFAGMPMILSVFSDLLGGVSTDYLSRRYGLRVGRCLIGGLSLLFAGSFLIFGTWTDNPYMAVAMLSFALAAANFLLGAAWGASVDMAGSHAGAISACMNTAGQVGGFICPIVVGWIVQHYGSWSASLYLTGGLYLFGAFCWLFIEPRKQIL